MCLLSVMTPMRFSRVKKYPEFALSVAVVDTRRVLRAQETTGRGVSGDRALDREG
jgi:hypothetical protein